MALRPAAETKESLRITLQELEENFASIEDEPTMAELKRIILLRIAEFLALTKLEAVRRHL